VKENAHMKKVKSLVVVLLLMGLALTGCTSKASGTIKVGLNLELSGEVASYGEAELNGIMMAIDEVNAAGGVLGKQIEVVKLDNKGDAAESTSVATKLATESKVSVILGPATSGAVKASVPVANQYKVAVITPSGTADDVTNDGTKAQPYAFRICFIDAFQGVTMANFASNNLSGKKAVILGDSGSDYALGLAKNFKAQFTKNGGTIVAEEAYTAADTDFNAVLTKIKNAGAFDVLFIPGYYQQVGLIIKQARAAGIDAPILGGDGFDSPKLLELAGAAALNKVYFSSAFTSLDTDATVVKFIAAYKAKYSAEPNMFNALGYDAAKLAIDAIKRANSSDPVKIQAALAATKDLAGVTGTVTIDALHNAVKSAVVITLKDGVQTSPVRVNP